MHEPYRHVWHEHPAQMLKLRDGTLSFPESPAF